MQRIASFISVYSSFLENAFLKMLAYRLRYFTGILTYLLFVSVHYFIWSAIFAGHEVGAKINGFSLTEMVTYVSIGWISRSLYHSNIDVEVEELVRSGRIGIYLLRPVDFQLMQLAQAIGESLFRLIFFTAPICAVILFLFPVSAPADFSSAIFFLVSTFLAFLILAHINFLVGMLAFWFKSIDGVMRAKYYLVQLFSGLVVPLTFFPSWFETVLNFLPFKMIAYVPLQFYLGKFSGVAAIEVLLQQLIWFFALAIFAKLIWNSAFRMLTVQRGVR